MFYKNGIMHREDGPAYIWKQNIFMKIYFSWICYGKTIKTIGTFDRKSTYYILANEKFKKYMKMKVFE